MQTGTLVKSDDPDEMPHNAFHQGLHCLHVCKEKTNLHDRNAYILVKKFTLLTVNLDNLKLLVLR